MFVIALLREVEKVVTLMEFAIIIPTFLAVLALAALAAWHGTGWYLNRYFKRHGKVVTYTITVTQKKPAD